MSFHLILIFFSLLSSSHSINRDLLFDDPISQSDSPSESPPSDPFIDLPEEVTQDVPPSVDDVTEINSSTSQPLKQRENREISESEGVISSLDSIDSYSSPLIPSPSSSYISSPSSSDKYSNPLSSSSLPSQYSQRFGSEPGAIIETGRFTVLSSKLLRGPSIPQLRGPSVVDQAAYGAYPTSGASQSYITGISPSSPSSYSSSPSIPLDSYSSSSQYGFYSNRDGIYHLNGPINGRRVVIYKKILRPVRIHGRLTIERLPGAQVVDQWAEGGYSSDLLNGRSSVDAPLFTPTD
ncbi:hypothetical protein PFISCL1PPCAC_14913, partial [Pristionchus fissidentatus]